MKTALLGLHAETPIHAGAGSSTGVIDLPIQREAPTDWPCIYGSAVKGALRTRAEEMDPANDWLTVVFGPDTPNASDHSGAVSVGDARLLLLPVRSLSTHFKWVTCPALLRRFAADCLRLGLENVPSKDEAPSPSQEEILIPEGSGPVFLEEFRLEARNADLNEWIECIHALFGLSEEDLRNQLAVVHNNLFSTLARFATPVNAHIAVVSETKTVKGGALWYEETLPPETVLYVPVMASKSRSKEKPMGAEEVLAHLTKMFEERSYLQVGGNETVGMGWCRVQTTTGGNA